MNDADMWAEMEAKEFRFWLMPGRTGLWCPTCLLPSGYEFAIQRDPAETPESWIRRCAEDEAHREIEEAP